jgi:tetratricopeptide (TPR) repeat protein
MSPPRAAGGEGWNVAISRSDTRARRRVDHARAALLLAVAVSIFASATASAEVPSLARADGLYAAGDAREALDEYIALYDATAAPSLLLPIGRCYARLGRTAEAIFFYRGYLERAPEARATDVAPLLEDAERAQRAAAPAPLYRKWWLWTLVGSAAVVGVTLGVVFAMQPWQHLPSAPLGVIDGR